MLTQRYGLYIILTGLLIIAVAIALLVAVDGYTLLLLLGGFNGLLVVLAGVWMWTVDQSTI
ncbi:hypothetical protein ACERK3_06810 [Phycisphaerales bacterium AB-hyl4]|uniref:Uncharacterized protein n=1 Tax=Natronomicrosphaera hydrolytica TaxID=3242702 RepID=A0ABV4U339_9BACT